MIIIFVVFIQTIRNTRIIFRTANHINRNEIRAQTYWGEKKKIIIMHGRRS